ncbi:MAG: thiopeptide-type bacteriocin biosynthesis protein, partial [Pseudonocardiaceae bacterium]
MNPGTDPQPTGLSWRQVFIQFDDYSAAEHIGVAHIGPDMTSAEAAGLIASWFFIRKAPCWRLRFLPFHDRTEQDATTFIHQQLTTLQEAGRVASWVETIYEPEMHAFGGAAAMDLAHHLFHSDSRHILAYLGNDRATTAGCGDRRRELSILLCSILMRGAGQDWYEQGDIWARVVENRSLPPDTPLDRLHTMESDLRQLMTVDASPASPLMQENGPLTVLSDWAAAFAEAGQALGHLARNGTLSRGARAVLAHHVIFHWNRIGLPHTTQSILA